MHIDTAIVILLIVIIALGTVAIIFMRLYEYQRKVNEWTHRAHNRYTEWLDKLSAEHRRMIEANAYLSVENEQLKAENQQLKEKLEQTNRRKNNRKNNPAPGRAVQGARR